MLKFWILHKFLQDNKFYFQISILKLKIIFVIVVVVVWTNKFKNWKLRFVIIKYIIIRKNEIKKVKKKSIKMIIDVDYYSKLSPSL